MKTKTIATLTAIVGTAALLTTIDATAEVAVSPGNVAKPGGAGPGADALLGPKINLQCKGGGASDVARIHNIKNITRRTIPKGRKINFSNQYGQNAVLTLQADLRPGLTTQAVQSGPTNGGFACSAYVRAGLPDLSIKSAKWISASDGTATQVEVVFKNENPLAPASGAKVRLNHANCQGNLPYNMTYNIPTVNTTRRVVYNFPKSGNAAFFWVRANATNSMVEANKTNNLAKSAEFASACGPR